MGATGDLDDANTSKIPSIGGSYRHSGTRSVASALAGRTASPRRWIWAESETAGGAATRGRLRYLKATTRTSTAGLVSAWVERANRAGPMVASQGGEAKSGGVGGGQRVGAVFGA